MLGSLRDKISKLPQPVLVVCIVLFALLGVIGVRAEEGIMELGQDIVDSVQVFILESQGNNRKQYSFKPSPSPITKNGNAGNPNKDTIESRQYPKKNENNENNLASENQNKGEYDKEIICLKDSIDINTASKADLERIIDVGPVTAEKIIELRRFSSLDDLVRVKGIAEITLEKIKEQGCAFVIEAAPTDNPEDDKQKSQEREEKRATEEIEEAIEQDEQKKIICFKNSIDINTASKADLEKIIDVGPVTAEKIIELRRFSSLDDLVRVKGIAEITLEKIKEQGCAFVIEAAPTDNPEDDKQKSQGQSEDQLVAGSVPEPEPDPSPEVEPQESALSVIINEIAWMGGLPKLEETTRQAANNEWIELFNNTDQDIDLTGWQLISLDNSPNIIFEEGAIILADNFFLLERTNDDAVSDILADWYGSFGRGGLTNKGEKLELRDSQNNLIDKVICIKEDGVCNDWQAGDNTSKKTMERKQDLRSWQTSLNSGGTPKAINSQ